MSTRVDERKPSPVQFIDTAKDLVAHSWRYLPKFPKATRYVFQTKLSDLAIEVYENAVKANTIFIRKENEADKESKRQYLVASLGALNSLEGLLAIVQQSHKQDITDYGWTQWGVLINQERALLIGLLKSI